MKILEGGSSTALGDNKIRIRIPPSAAEIAEARKGGAEYIRENVRKLSLWHTRTFKPIATHDELDGILSTLGFVGLLPRVVGGVVWKEYKYSATWHGGSGGNRAGLPGLPYPRIDGLHMITYAMFLEAVGFSLQIPNVADLFHVRGMPLHRVYDRNERWRRMEDDEFSVFLYRYGTLDQKINSFSLRNYQNDILNFNTVGSDSMLIHKHKTNETSSQIVPLKDIIV